MARDDIAAVRGLAAELGYRLEPLPIKGCWQLVNEETSEIAKRPDGASAFNASQALSFFRSLRRLGTSTAR